MTDGDLESILRDNYSLIRAVCWRILRHDADTDDATQNALISIARSMPSFDGRSSMSTWIYRIATNAALDELRRRQRRTIKVVNGLDQAPEFADPRSEDPHHSLESREVLDEALERVPEEFRVPLVLRDVADLEYDDIARILDLPAGTVRSRISRGRSRLAAEWSKIDGNPPALGRRPTSDARTQTMTSDDERPEDPT